MRVLSTVAAFSIAVMSVSAQEPAATTVRLAVDRAANEHVTLASAGLTVAATWAATPANGQTAIYVAISRDGGRTFSPPVRVGSRASVNDEQPPRVGLIPSRSGEAGTAAVVVVWTAKAGDGSRLMSARSPDGGRTFGAAAVVPGSAAPGNRGWHSLAVDPSGRPIVLWLDHRDGVKSSSAGHHHHDSAPSSAAAEESVARAAASRLYVGSADGSVPVQGLVHGVCYCCKTAVAVSPAGGVVAAWRHVYPGGFRDIAFSQSSDGGHTFSTPARVHEDGWQLAGCPENGPAIGVDGDGRTHVIWPTLIRDQGRETMALFHSMTKDGRTFTMRTRIPAADAAFHPQLAISPGGDLFVAWDEGSSGTRRVRVAKGRVEADGQVRFGADRGFSAPGTHPSVAVTPTGAALAWTSTAGGETVIRAAEYR